MTDIELDQSAINSLLSCPETQKLLAKKAREGASIARNLAPIDTGELKDSIEAEPDDDGGWVYGSDVEHAIFMEKGFRHYQTGKFVGPFPFLEPAAYAIQESE